MGRLEKKIKQTKLKQQMQEIFVSGCGGKIHGQCHNGFFYRVLDLSRLNMNYSL